MVDLEMVTTNGVSDVSLGLFSLLLAVEASCWLVKSH